MIAIGLSLGLPYELGVGAEDVVIPGEGDYLVDENGNLVLDENGNPIPIT